MSNPAQELRQLYETVKEDILAKGMALKDVDEGFQELLAKLPAGYQKLAKEIGLVNV